MNSLVLVRKHLSEELPLPLSLERGKYGEKTVRLYRCSGQFSLLF
nr:MAG TPA: hypothetical protein [Bacteriophage sp.]